MSKSITAHSSYVHTIIRTGKASPYPTLQPSVHDLRVKQIIQKYSPFSGKYFEIDRLNLAALLLTDEMGNSLLHDRISKNNELAVMKIIELMSKHGVYFWTYNLMNQTPFSLALEKKMDYAAISIASASEENTKLFIRLHPEIIGNVIGRSGKDLINIFLTLADKKSLSYVNREGNSLLHIAFHESITHLHGNFATRIRKLLLNEIPEHIFTRDKMGDTIVHLAARTSPSTLLAICLTKVTSLADLLALNSAYKIPCELATSDVNQNLIQRKMDCLAKKGSKQRTRTDQVNESPPTPEAFLLDLNESPPTPEAFLLDLNESPPTPEAFLLTLNASPCRGRETFLKIFIKNDNSLTSNEQEILSTFLSHALTNKLKSHFNDVKRRSSIWLINHLLTNPKDLNKTIKMLKNQELIAFLDSFGDQDILSFRDEENKTLLHLVWKTGKKAVTEYLLNRLYDQKAYLMVKDNSQTSLLDDAINCQDAFLCWIIFILHLPNSIDSLFSSEIEFERLLFHSLQKKLYSFVKCLVSAYPKEKPFYLNAAIQQLVKREKIETLLEKEIYATPSSYIPETILLKALKEAISKKLANLALAMIPFLHPPLFTLIEQSHSLSLIERAEKQKLFSVHSQMKQKLKDHFSAPTTIVYDLNVVSEAHRRGKQEQALYPVFVPNDSVPPLAQEIKFTATENNVSFDSIYSSLHEDGSSLDFDPLALFSNETTSSPSFSDDFPI